MLAAPAVIFFSELLYQKLKAAGRRFAPFQAAFVRTVEKNRPILASINTRAFWFIIEITLTAVKRFYGATFIDG